MKRVRRLFQADSVYDLVVIGGGAAGSAATNTAVQSGGRVALVEQHLLGGT
jgi:pyruvate/2-oxoglutarate dehydrogenase complex dihydrolipoamide dehydrogenase (E3) component